MARRNAIIATAVALMLAVSGCTGSKVLPSPSTTPSQSATPSTGTTPGSTGALDNYTVDLDISGAQVKMTVNNWVMHPTDCCALAYYYQFDEASLVSEQISDTEYQIKGNVVLTSSAYDHDKEVCSIDLSGYDTAGNFLRSVKFDSEYAGAHVPIGQSTPFVTTLTGPLADIGSLWLQLDCPAA